MIRLTLFLLLVLGACSTSTKENTQPNLKPTIDATDGIEILASESPDTLKGSIRARAIGRIGADTVVVSYHSPAVRDRILWGGLVPYDKVWVTGAHMATSITLTGSVLVGETELPPGKYALFTIPGKDEWIWVINSDWNQHLTDKYDSSKDIVRLTVKPHEEMKRQERLRFWITSENETTSIVSMQWNTTRIDLPITQPTAGSR